MLTVQGPGGSRRRTVWPAAGGLPFSAARGPMTERPRSKTALFTSPFAQQL